MKDLKMTLKQRLIYNIKFHKKIIKYHLMQVYWGKLSPETVGRYLREFLSAGCLKKDKKNPDVYRFIKLGRYKAVV